MCFNSFASNDFSSDVMIPKKIEWSILAQCDFFAVQRIVETPNRPAMKALEPMQESIFEKKLKKDLKWKQTYEAVSLSYKSLPPDFQICHDNFGGYRLIYSGTKVLYPSSVLRRNPIGFVSPIPEGVVTNLSVMSSERTGQQLLLLGPIRFVNSDCSPNCDYDFSSDAGLVQLRVKRRINPGEELFVKYGPEFFEINSCLCRTCEVEKSQHEKDNIAFDLLLIAVLSDLAEEEISNFVSENLHSPTSPEASNVRKKRIRGRELVEMFNAATSSPLSVSGSPPGVLYASPVSQRVGSPFEREEDISSVGLSSEVLSEGSDTTSESLHQSLSEVSEPSPHSNEMSSDEDKSNQLIVLNNSTDSPNFLSSSPNFEVLETENFLEQFLYEGSNISCSDAVSVTDLFCSRFKLTDECSSSLHSLIKTLLPAENSFPSGYSYVKRVKKQFLMK